MVCGYDSAQSLAFSSDGSSLFVRFEEEQSWGSPAAWAQWLSTQGSGLRHRIHVGQWDRVAAWVRWIMGGWSIRSKLALPLRPPYDRGWAVTVFSFLLCEMGL